MSDKHYVDNSKFLEEMLEASKGKSTIKILINVIPIMGMYARCTIYVITAERQKKT